MDMDEKLVSDWTDFGKTVSQLTADVVASDFEPECILAVTRGGLVLGGALSHRLRIKDVICVNIEFYRGNGVDDVRLPEPVLLEPGLSEALLVNKRVLIVDDIVDTGATLDFLLEKVRPIASDVRSAAWYYKGCPTRPDFFVENTQRWVVAPWNPNSPLI